MPDNPQETERAANLFDLRRIIGGLFLLYGAVLTVVGITDGDAALHTAAGLRINLIAGLGMLVLGALFVAWALLRPLGQQLTAAEREPRQGEPEGPAG
jgi:ABC-type branched-subunit amino acid transport system permease subunit